MSQDITNAGSTEVAHSDAPADSMLSFISMAVRDPGIDVAKLDALLRMQREVKADDAKAQFTRAFAQLQQRLPRIERDAVIAHPQKDGSSKKISEYATWDAIDEAIRPIYTELGFSLHFETAPRAGEGGGMQVTAVLGHEAGHSIQATVAVPLDTSGSKNNVQAYGSAMSYGRRYAATALLNITTKGQDDDGKMAGLRLITKEQVDELRRLIVETKTDDARFCQFLGVASIENIEAGSFAPAKNMLLGKLRKTEAKE